MLVYRYFTIQLFPCMAFFTIRSCQSIHGRRSDTNLAEIYEEMSELLDKQVNVQKESLKKLSGFMQAPVSPRKKCAMKMKERKKKTTAM